MFKRTSLLRGTAAAALLVCVSSPSLAQESFQLEEIIVTAQKREQNLQDVPITVTAYTGDFLEAIGVEEFDQLSAFVPGLNVQEQSVNNPGFVIRGITSDSGAADIAPRVSIYQDGIDVSRSRGSIFELFDVERIEAVKGPQATLFGTAASVGAVSVISNRPQQEFDAQVKVGFGNFGEKKASGFITGGNDVIQARIAGTFKNRDGFIENIAGGPNSQNPEAPDERALNGTQSLAFRGIMRVLPTTDIRVDIIGFYQHDTPPGTSFKSGVLPPTGGTVNPNSFAELAGSPFSREHLGGDLGIDREVYGLTIDAVWDINEQFTLTSITGLRQFNSLEVFDADGSQAYFLEFAEDAVGEQFSTELRLNYDPSDELSAFLGVSVFDESGEQAVPFSTDEGIFLACAGGNCLNADGSVNSILPFAAPYNDAFGNRGDQETYSVYADATYYIFDNLDVTAGIRWVKERRTSGAFQNGTPALVTGFTAPLLNFGNTNGTIVESDTESFDAWLPRFNVHYAFNDELSVYSTISKGRRSDLVDVGVTGSPFDPEAVVTILPGETIWNYEAGVKSTWLEGRAQVNAAGFYQKYKNFQTSIFNPGTGEITPVNAGSATMKGAEVEITAQPFEWVRAFYNVSYIDATFDEFDENGNPQAFAGNQFRLQPKWSASGGLLIELAMSDSLDFFLTPTYTFRSKVFFDNDNAQVAGLDIAERSYNLFNIRGGLRSADGTWELEGYVENLWNTEYIIDAGNTGGAFGIPTFIAGPPRFFGMGVTYNF